MKPHADLTFATRGDGQIDAHLGDPWTVFDHALGDAISSLPPRGATGSGPSTYWIDVAEKGARWASTAGDTRPFIWGNVTYLRFEGRDVIAAYEFDPDENDAESMPLDDFLGLLAEWRKRVLAAGSRSMTEFPETYRRNPILLGPGDDAL